MPILLPLLRGLVLWWKDFIEDPPSTCLHLQALGRKMGTIWYHVPKHSWPCKKVPGRRNLLESTTNEVLWKILDENLFILQEYWIHIWQTCVKTCRNVSIEENNVFSRSVGIWLPPRFSESFKAWGEWVSMFDVKPCSGESDLASLSLSLNYVSPHFFIRKMRILVSNSCCFVRLNEIPDEKHSAQCLAQGTCPLNINWLYYQFSFRTKKPISPQNHSDLISLLKGRPMKEAEAQRNDMLITGRAWIRIQSSDFSLEHGASHSRGLFCIV